MIRAKESAATAAPYDVPVMLVGASGSGKEMFAQSIHNASSRRNGPSVGSGIQRHRAEPGGKCPVWL